MKKKRLLTAIILLILVATVTIGYSILSTTLNISGTSGINSATWNIYFDNVKEIDGSITPTKSATISTTKNKVSFVVSFNEPGEFYSFNVDIVNDGTIPGMINLITLNGIPDEYSDVALFTVKNLDGSDIKEHQLVDAKDITRLLVTVKYNDDIEIDDLLPENLPLDMSISFEIIQADDTINYGPMNVYKRIAYYWKDNGAKVSSKSGTGIFEFDSTKDDQYPVYYYSTRIDSNNIIFGGYCWKIIRTTSTQGVKLLYNGTPEDNQCTTINPGFNYEQFNTNLNSFTYHSYMYGDTTLNGSTGSINYSSRILDTINMSSMSLYFGTGFQYNSSSHDYTLIDPVLLGEDDIDQILSTYMYTLHSSNPNAQSQSRYIVKGSNGGTTLYTYNPYYGGYFYVSDNITYNNGSAQLVSPSYYYFSSFPDGAEDLVGKYIKSYNSSIIIYVKSVSDTGVSGLIANKMYYFGEGYEYIDGKYNLTGDIFYLDDWDNSDNISTHRYFCLNYDTSCEQLAYAYQLNDDYVKYILLTDGGDIQYSFSKMFTNTYDSNSKTIVDNWYRDNMLDYDKYIEDTPYCNDRRISSSNFDPNGDSIKMNTTFAFYSRSGNYQLTCEKNDSFTVNESDIGNGDLTYPVGLMTADEMELAGGGSNSNSYIATSTKVWSMTPYFRRYNVSDYIFNYIQGPSWSSYYSFVYGSAYHRPVVSINTKVLIVDGDGSTTNPYKVFYLDED